MWEGGVLRAALLLVVPVLPEDPAEHGDPAERDHDRAEDDDRDGAVP